MNESRFLLSQLIDFVRDELLNCEWAQISHKYWVAYQSCADLNELKTARSLLISTSTSTCSCATFHVICFLWLKVWSYVQIMWNNSINRAVVSHRWSASIWIDKITNFSNFSMDKVLLKWVIKLNVCGDWKDFMKVNICMIVVVVRNSIFGFVFSTKVMLHWPYWAPLCQFCCFRLFNTLTPQSDKCIFYHRICLK